MVSGGADLWLEAEAREVAVAWHWSGEGKIAALGRGNSAGGGVPYLKGGSVGRQQRGVGGGQVTCPTCGGSGAGAGRGSLPTGSGPRPVGAVTCVVHARLAEQRGRGEADRWAVGTVPGGSTNR
jgi:hypothetical protein